MTLGALGLGYLGLGAVIAIGVTITIPRPSLADVVLLIGLWPIATPLVLAGHRDENDLAETELLAALERASASPLASVLPDAETARVLARRLRAAGIRVTELDGLLARSDFDPRQAEHRARELEGRGATAAAATAQLRVRMLGQLLALRERYRSERDEIRELISQLLIQAELIRLQPSIAHTSGELVARVEALGDDDAKYQPRAARSD